MLHDERPKGDDDLNFTQYDDGEFIITAKEPKFSNIHGFVDDDEEESNTGEMDAFDQLA